jgi:F0F1-type ATP synthase membrane subunit b/b'
MTTEVTELSSADYLEKALEDLNQARQHAEEELRSVIDSAIGRAREALDELRSDAEDRAESLKARAEDRASEWQQMLEDASEDVRRELGLRTIRAQHSQSALKEMAGEIKQRKHELTASH